MFLSFCCWLALCKLTIHAICFLYTYIHTYHSHYIIYKYERVLLYCNRVCRVCAAAMRKYKLVGVFFFFDLDFLSFCFVFLFSFFFSFFVSQFLFYISNSKQAIYVGNIFILCFFLFIQLHLYSIGCNR